MIKKKTISRILHITAWVLISSAIVVLLVSAIRTEQYKVCKEVAVEFSDRHSFIMLEEKEVLSNLFPETNGVFPKGKRLAYFDLFSLEKRLEKNSWVKKADLYFDRQQVLRINVTQREPLARLFTPAGNSYYMDESFSLLPLKSNVQIDLPVFTNFYLNPSATKAADTLLMDRISSLSRFILADSFWMAQIEEVNISADNGFELYTQFGDHTVMLGQRSDWSNLFSKLKILYKGIQSEGSWGKYTKIDLQFKDQAVCVRKNDVYRVVDSTKTMDSVITQNKTKNTTPEKNNL